MTFATNSEYLVDQMCSGTDYAIVSYEYNKATPPSWMTELESFARYAVGWDGYKATPPSQLAIEQAIRLVQTLDEFRLMPNRIAASVAGGVGLSIMAGTRKVYVEIYNDGRVYMMKSCRGSDVQVFPVRDETDRDRQEIVTQVRDYLGR